ncbi:MAG: ThuA domain-containing protein [Bryobacterales bacterium]|nr:ThuA domain-containing protein [Bryobacterales bacterium]
MSTNLTRICPAILAMGLLLPEALPQAPSGGSQAAERELAAQADSGRRRRRPPDPFAGQKRIRALVITGGCCHDYAGETKILMDMMASEAPVDWTVVLETEGRSTWTTTKLRLYNQPNWSEGYDIVVHNECFANVDDAEFVRKIVAGHDGGLPAVVIHCSMHSYRALESDEWREFLGVTTRRHTRQHRIAVQVKDANHPVMKGFPLDWVTPMDELYVIDKLWPGAKSLASAVDPESGHEHPLVWTNDYRGARVFGTTLGHGPATWDDPTFRDLLARGFKWAVNWQRH